MWHFYLRRFLFVSLFISSFSCFAAEEVGSSEVYQVTESIVTELSRMHKVNSSQLIDVYEVNTSGKKSRHVIQKARELFIRVQQIRMLHGLTEHPIPMLLASELQPKHVKILADKILQDLISLETLYGVQQPLAMPAKAVDKTPSDVYQLLHKAVYMTSGLGVSEVSASNVYRVASAAVYDLRLIRAELALEDIMRMEVSFGRKEPRDVHNEARVLIDEIRLMCERKPNICSSDGVKSYKNRTWEFFAPNKPKYVLDVLDNAVAEISYIKSSLGIETSTLYPPFIPGKTPTDVYFMVKKAQALVKEIM